MSAPTNQQEISVTVSGDRSRALVVIPSGYNADLVDLDTLIAVARAQGVVVEDREKNELLDACSEFKATGERVEHCFASALPPKRGEDTEIVWEPGFDPDAEEERCSESSVDHYSANSLTEVVEGDAIGTIRERCPGVEGRDVLGNAIPAPRGDDGPLNFCAKSFAIGGDGRIVALTAGVLRIDRGECSIDDVLHIRGNVNFETGNIETRGSVRVTGDVKDRFVVKAQKDVYVGGLIEAATIVCGGSLTANTGMTARSTGTLDVGGDLTIGFMDEVDATVHGSVHLKREAMATTFRVGGDFDAQTAALIGGDITVGGSLRVGQLGSSSETPTTVRLGSLPMLEQEIAEAREAARDADRAFRATRSQEEQLKSMSRFVAYALFILPFLFLVKRISLPSSKNS
ncbi:MAG: FapA family protein, partial [Planctomycetota bacterium]